MTNMSVGSMVTGSEGPRIHMIHIADTGSHPLDGPVFMSGEIALINKQDLGQRIPSILVCVVEIASVGPRAAKKILVKVCKQIGAASRVDFLVVIVIAGPRIIIVRVRWIFRIPVIVVFRTLALRLD